MKKLIVGVLIVGFVLLSGPKKLVADDLIPKTIDDYIHEIFGSKATIAKAVLTHESEGLKLDSKNYNCRYNGKSTFCKPQDRKKAWSVDCGISQINVKGTECPADLLTLEGNMKATEKIYKEQGLNAWVSFKNGAYKRFL